MMATTATTTTTTMATTLAMTDDNSNVCEESCGMCSEVCECDLLIHR